MSLHTADLRASWSQWSLALPSLDTSRDSACTVQGGVQVKDVGMMPMMIVTSYLRVLLGFF